MIENIKSNIENNPEKNLHLYFITRKLKPNVKKRSKVLDKYDFKVYQVDINKDIRSHLRELTIEQLSNILKRDLETSPYDPITDDTKQIFTYDTINKGMSFIDVVQNQLKNRSKIPKVKNFADILIDDEEMWAYSVGFYSESDDWIYTFRKVLRGKIAIDEEETQKRSFLRTKFNTESKKLELLKGETINLDEKVDCVFHDQQFLIVHKTQFESITCLTEEFRNHADTIADELIETEMFTGMELLKTRIEEHPAIHKKLVRLKKSNNYEELNEDSIDRMIEIAKKYGKSLKKDNGKIVIEDKDDIELSIKVLVDFYKKGEFSGKAYGTFSGKELTENK